ncbi:MAG TPA: acetylglutamate kinase [Bryobacteraceae bacterium]|nr:acetylglutamate kinase [Bryobacteraceae bacterium]
MKILIKLGGTLLDAADSRERLAREVAELARQDQVVVVHGGGKQMTRFLAERGIESTFINGLRVTTPEVIDAVVKVFAGSVNVQLVAAFRKAGARPVGLNGLSAGLVDAVQLSPDLGQVGKPVSSDGGLLNLLVSQGYLPVVACVAGDSSGAIYNVNGDQMAVSCAMGFCADKLIFLTDVEGVRDASGHIRAQLSAPEAAELIRGGVATGGMQAKLEAAAEALREGVLQVLIAPGAHPGIIASLRENRPAIGTMVVPSETFQS